MMAGSSMNVRGLRVCVDGEGASEPPLYPYYFTVVRQSTTIHCLHTMLQLDPTAYC